MEIIENLIKYEYLQNAYAIGLLIGFLAPLLGAYIILKKLALVVEAISHIAMAGITLSFALDKYGILSISPFYFAFTFSSLGLILIERIGNSFKTYKEIAIPIMISFSTALVILFSSLADGFNKDIMSYLFGSILTTTSADVIVMIIATFITVLLLYKFHSQLVVFAIDAEYAKFSGINVRIYKVIFNILLAIFTVLAIKVVGMLLVGALIIIPISSASKICNSLKITIILAIIFSEFSVIIGLVSSYYLNIPSGATIVFANIIIFLSTVIYGKVKRSFL